MLKKISSHKIGTMYVIILAISLLVSFLTPITGDDFTFLAYSANTDTIKGFFDAQLYMHGNLNGRVLGNGLEFLLIESPILSALVRSLVMFGAVVVAVKIISPKNRLGLLIAIGLLFLLPIPILTQTYLWQAGFFNYVTSTFAVLLIIFLIRRVQDLESASWINYTSLFLVGIAGSLFAENVTVVGFVTLMSFMVYSIFKKNLNSIRATLPALAGTIVGMIIMFSSPVYGAVASGEDGYRSVGGGVISQLVDSAYGISNGLIGMWSVLVTILLSIVTYTLLYRRKERRLMVWVAILFGYPVWCIAGALIIGDSITGTHILIQYGYKVAHVLIAVIYMVSILIALFRSRRTMGERFSECVAYFILSVGFVAPFLVISPFGPRNFLLSYFLLVIVGMIIFNSVFKVDNKNVLNACVAMFVAGGLVVASAASVNKMYQDRNINTIKEGWSSGASEVSLLKPPFRKLIHDPVSSKKIERYASKMDCSYTNCLIKDLEIKVLFK